MPGRVPGVVKGVKPAVVGPGEVGWMETLFFGSVGMYFANEGKRAVEVGVPGDRANGGEGRGD